MLSAWQPGGRPPTPAQRAMAAVWGAAARVASGMQKRFEEDRKSAQDLLALETARARQAASAGATGSSPSSGKCVKLANVIDRTSDDEARPLTKDEIDAAYDRCDQKLGGMPPEDQETTVEQLAVRRHLVKTELAPHADFGIFGPHAIHIQQMVKLTGMIPNTSGGLFRSEMAGPMTVEQWESCYRVSRTAMLILRVAWPSSLDSYLDHANQYHMRYSHECWAVLYQTDTRARHELAERIRRRGRIKYDEVAATTPETQRVSHTYDPQIPWDFVFRLLWAVKRLVDMMGESGTHESALLTPLCRKAPGLPNTCELCGRRPPRKVCQQCTACVCRRCWDPVTRQCARCLQHGQSLSHMVQEAECGEGTASDEHFVGTSAGVRRCRSIWRRPESSRWDKKALEVMIGEPWDPKAQPGAERTIVHRGVYITLERQIKHGGTKGCPACFGEARIHSAACRTRFRELMDAEAARATTAGSTASGPTDTGIGAGSTAPAAAVEARPEASSTGDVQMAGVDAGSTAPQGDAMGDEPRTTTARKRQRIVAGMPTLHEHELEVVEKIPKELYLAAVPTTAGDWQQEIVDWNREYYGTKSTRCWTSRKSSKAEHASSTTCRGWRSWSRSHWPRQDSKGSRSSMRSGWTTRRRHPRTRTP